MFDININTVLYIYIQQYIFFLYNKFNVLYISYYHKVTSPCKNRYLFLS